jgi:hypothetical protein
MNENKMIEELGIELDESVTVEEVVDTYVRKMKGEEVKGTDNSDTYTDEEWEELIKEFL